MNYIKNKIRSVVKKDEHGFNLLQWLLQLISYGYGAGLAGRERLYRMQLLKTYRLPCRVVSVGNLVAGGTGKTPMTMYVARLVQSLGYKAAVVSRGYKGGAEKSGGIVSDGRRIRMAPAAAGDEPYLLAQSLPGIPVLVGRDRYASGMAAVQTFSVDVVVLDDAFQHIRLKRDIDLVLLDHRRPFGNGRLLPMGMLREPMDALLRSDAVILTRSLPEETSASQCLRKMASPRPVFKSRHLPAITRVVASAESTGPREPPVSGFDDLKQRRVFAFSGLADNLNFRDTLSEMGARLVGFDPFPDHHPYSDADLAAILQSASAAGAEVAATTAKDFGKIAGRIRWPIELVVLGVEVSFDDEDKAFREFIQKRLLLSGSRP